MANSFELSVDVAAPPDDVWRIVSDSDRITEWFEAVVGVEVEGDERHVTTAQGARFTERVFDRDDQARRYSYSIVAGNPALTSHEAGFAVHADGAGSRVVWAQAATSDVEGFDLERRLSGVMRQGLDALKRLAEA